MTATSAPLESDFPDGAGAPRIRVAEWVCLGAVLVLHAVFLERVKLLTVDDALITIRQARNLVEGYGFVYNPGGPRVESYTNHLLFLWQALTLWLGGNALTSTKLLGAAGSSALIVGAWLLARDLVRWSGAGLERLPAPVLFFGPLLLAISPLVTFGAMAGLETALFGGLVTLGVWQVLRVFHGEALPWGAGALFGLALWTRPEGLIWLVGYGVVLGLVAWRQGRAWKPLAVALATGLGFWLALAVFRLAVFGRLHPNTYYIKMAGDPVGRFFSGLNYVRDWAVLNFGFGWIALGVAAAFLQLPARRAPALVVLLGLLGHLVLVAVEGGDWMPHLRLIAPAMGIALGLAATGVALAWLRVAPRLGRAFRPVAAVGTLVLAFGAYQIVLAEEYRAFGEAQTRIFGWNDAHIPLGKWLGEWQLRRLAADREGLTVAIEDIGWVGWYSEAQIVDLAGLADPDWAREVYDSGREAVYPAGPLIHDVRPEVVVLVSLTGPRESPRRILWPSNKAIYTHPDFLKNYREKVIFTHKDFPGDGYFLHVFLRNDVFDEPPAVTPPKARAVGR
ncbi:MAG: arabinofuranosyltransferase [Candidatus Sumerlaeota bacterium]|nr:arabinofuranosyltransferase [Candidatus Sumerlaeota bacterium]